MLVDIPIPDSKIFSCLVSALEGGSNYWYEIVGQHKPVRWNCLEDEKAFCASYPFNQGGFLMIDDSRADEPTLKKPTKVYSWQIKQGLRIMATEYPNHFGDLLSDNADQNTGDVMLQCIVLGEVLYG